MVYELSLPYRPTQNLHPYNSAECFPEIKPLFIKLRVTLTLFDSKNSYSDRSFFGLLVSFDPWWLFFIIQYMYLLYLHLCLYTLSVFYIVCLHRMHLHLCLLAQLTVLSVFCNPSLTMSFSMTSKHCVSCAIDK